MTLHVDLNPLLFFTLSCTQTNRRGALRSRAAGALRCMRHLLHPLCLRRTKTGTPGELELCGNPSFATNDVQRLCTWQQPPYVTDSHAHDPNQVLPQLSAVTIHQRQPLQVTPTPAHVALPSPPLPVKPLLPHSPKPATVAVSPSAPTALVPHGTPVASCPNPPTRRIQEYAKLFGLPAAGSMSLGAPDATWSGPLYYHWRSAFYIVPVAFLPLPVAGSRVVPPAISTFPSRQRHAPTSLRVSSCRPWLQFLLKSRHHGWQPWIFASFASFAILLWTAYCVA